MLRGCKRHGRALVKSVSEHWHESTSTGSRSSPSYHQLLERALTNSRSFCCSHVSVQPFSPFASHGLYQDPRQRPEAILDNIQRALYATSSGPPSSDPPDPDAPPQDSADPAQQFTLDREQRLPSESDGEPGEDFKTQQGPRPMSLEEYDGILDRWGELLREGKLDEVLDLMEYTYGGYEPLPPLEEMLAEGSEDKGKAERRAREQALQEDFARQRVQVIDDLGRSYATGKRKTSIARVWLKEGSGVISVNGKGFDYRFPTLERRQDVLAPFAVTGTYGMYDVKATVRGGGMTGQAQALRHGIGKALQLYDPTLRPRLKSAGYLSRDARVVERKKPGRAKARRSFQWVKR